MPARDPASFTDAALRPRDRERRPARPSVTPLRSDGHPAPHRGPRLQSMTHAPGPPSAVTHVGPARARATGARGRSARDPTGSDGARSEDVPFWAVGVQDDARWNRPLGALTPRASPGPAEFASLDVADRPIRDVQATHQTRRLVLASFSGSSPCASQRARPTQRTCPAIKVRSVAPTIEAHYAVMNEMKQPSLPDQPTMSFRPRRRHFNSPSAAVTTSDSLGRRRSRAQWKFGEPASSTPLRHGSLQYTRPWPT